MKSCPICHVRLSSNEQITCTRCGSDLSLLLKIEKEANQLLSVACYNLSGGQYEQALIYIEQSLWLYNSLLGRMLYRFVSLFL